MMKKRMPLLVVVFFSFLVVVIGLMANLFSGDNLSYADELTNFNLHREKEELIIGEDSSFALDFLDKKRPDKVVIEYPENYQFNKVILEQDNIKSVVGVEVDEEKHLLTFELIKDVEEPIKISGNFTEAGEHHLFVQINDKKEDVTFVVQTQTVTSTTVESTSSSEVISASENSEITVSSKNSSESEDTIGDISSESTEVSTEQTPKSTTPATPPTNFDWSKLDVDEVDLTTFTEQTKNVPTLLTGGVFDKAQRNYYLFFGHVSNQNYYNTSSKKFETYGNMNVPLGSDSKIPIMSPGIIGVKKNVGTLKKVNVFGYDYQYEVPDSGAGLLKDHGLSSSRFDIGELDSNGSQIKESNYVSWNTDLECMNKLYTKNNEIIAYGFVPRRSPALTPPAIGTPSDITYMPVKVHGYVSNIEEGRVRYDISYLNDTTEEKSYVTTYGLHVDIGGAHQSSKLYSNGSNGLYFNEPNGTPADGISARLYFYLGKSNYPDLNGPIDFKVGNLGGGINTIFSTNAHNIASWQNGTIDSVDWKDGRKPSYMNPLGEWDKTIAGDQLYDLSHPVFAYRWNPQVVEPGEVGTSSFDLSILEPDMSGVEAEKIYENISNQNGKNAVNDTLQFKLIAKNINGTQNWDDVVISDTISQMLDVDIDSFKLVSSDGEIENLPSTIYNPKTRELKTAPTIIPKSKTIALVFEAKINSKASGEVVTNKMIASSDNEHTVTNEISLAVDENYGDLNFLSAPNVLRFGDNLKISTKDQEYALEKVEGTDLQVQDTRETGHWKMTAKLLDEFISDSGSILKDGLHYRNESNDQVFTKEASILIKDQQSESKDVINLSSEWQGTINGPVLVVPAGSVLPEKYSSSIQWTLEDVPTNEEISKNNDE